METNYTKGKWDYSIENVTKGTAKDGMYCRIYSGGTEVAKTTMIQEIPISKIELANAKLIASAPDLFEAHNENIQICDLVLNAFTRNDISTMMKLVAQIKSNCLSATLRVIE